MQKRPVSLTCSPRKHSSLGPSGGSQVNEQPQSERGPLCTCCSSRELFPIKKQPIRRAGRPGGRRTVPHERQNAIGGGGRQEPGARSTEKSPAAPLLPLGAEGGAGPLRRPQSCPADVPAAMAPCTMGLCLSRMLSLSPGGCTGAGASEIAGSGPCAMHEPADSALQRVGHRNTAAVSETGGSSCSSNEVLHSPACRFLTPS